MYTILWHATNTLERGQVFRTVCDELVLTEDRVDFHKALGALASAGLDYVVPYELVNQVVSSSSIMREYAQQGERPYIGPLTKAGTF